MALQRIRLADIQYVSDTAAAIYTNPASTKTFVRGIIVFNGNTTTETVLVYNVPDATGSVGTAGAANQFLEMSIVAKDTAIVDFPYPLVLSDTNDTLQAVTDTASMVTIQVLGDTDA